MAKKWVFMGVMALIVASVVAVAVLGKYPRMKTPKRVDLTRATDAKDATVDLLSMTATEAVFRVVWYPSRAR